MKNVTDQLKITDSIFRSLFENSPLGMIICSSSEWVAVHVNESVCTMLGYRAEEMLGLKLEAITYPEDLQLVLTLFQKIVNRELSTSELETRFLTKHGDVVWANSCISILTDDAEATNHAVILIQDISERKKQETAHQEIGQRYKRLVESSPICIHELDLDGCFLSMNPAGIHMLDLPNDKEIIGNLYFNTIAETDQARVRELFADACEGKFSDFQFRGCRGNRVFKSCFAPVLNERNKVVSIMGLTQDVTDLMHAQSSLHEAFVASDALLNALDGAAVLVDTNGVLLSANQVMADRFQKPLGELIGINAFSLFPADLAKQRRKKFEEVLSTGKVINFTDERDGRVLHHTISPILNEQHQVVKLAAYSVDITEQIRLQKNLELKNFAIDESINGMAMSDIQGKLFYVNKACLQMWRYTNSMEVIGKSVFDFWKWSGAAEDVTKILLEKKHWEGELIALRSDNTEAILQVSAKLLFRHTEPIALMASFVDITERKQAEKALLENEILVKKAQEIALLGTFKFNPATQFVEGSDELFRIFGISREEFLFKDFVNSVHPKEREFVVASIQTAIETYAKYDITHKLLTRDGMEKYVRAVGETIRDARGALLLIGTVQDITKQHEYEENLKQSQQHLSTVVNNAPLVLFSIDNQGIFTLSVGKGLELLGLTPNQVLGLSAFDVYKDFPEVVANLKRALGGETVRFNSTLEPLFFEAVYSPLLNSKGDIIGATGIGLDVTSQKLAEQSLRQSEQQLSLIFNASSDSLILIEVMPEDRFICEKVNTTYLEGMKTSFPGISYEFIGRDRKEIMKACGFSQEIIDYEILQYRKAAETRELVQYEMNFPARHGLLCVEVTVRPIVDSGGHCTRLLRNGRDISERKKAEHLLRESEERLSLALSASNQGIYDLNLLTGEAEVSDEYVSMLGYDPANFKETNSFWKERLHPDDKELVFSTFEAYIKGEINEYKVEFRNLTKAGAWIWILSVGKIVSWDPEGKPIRMIGTHRDITEYKKTELAIKQTNKELQEIIDALDQSSLVSITDKKGIILKVNKRFCEVAGYREDELLGNNHKIINSGFHDKKFWKDFWETINRGEVWKGEIRNKAKDGTEYWVDTVINPIRNEHGEIVHYLSIRQDITDRKIYEKLLLQSNSRLAQIEQFVDFTTDAIQVSDEQGKLIYLNHVAAERLGIDKNECSSFHVWDFEQTLKEGNSWKRHIEELRNNGHISSEGINSNQKTGVQFPVEVTIRYVVIQNKGYIIAVSRDITERKKNETLLHEHEIRLLEAQRLAKLGYWEVDLITRKVWWSDQQYEIYGITKSDLPPSQESFFSLAHPDDKAVFSEMLNKATPESAEFSIDFKIVRPSKEVRAVHAIVRTFFNEQGQPIKIMGINQDITEKYIADNLLKESEDTLRKAQQVAKIGSWKLDVKNDVLEWSDEVYAIFNVPRSQKLTYEDFLSYIHPEDKENVDKAWKAALSGANYDIVHRILVNNSVKWVREQAELSFDEYRNLTYGFGTVQDITDQKNLQEANLIFNESQLLTGLGSWRWSLKSGEVYWSDNIYFLFGLNKATTQPSYENYLNAIYSEDRDYVKTLGEASLANKSPYEIEFRVEIRPNEIRWLVNKGNVLTDQEGNAIEIYGIVRDITVDKLSKEELIEAKKRAEEASFVKDEFLSVMSHEIRTPLNSVIGLSNLLLRRNPREDQVEVIKILKSSGDNLMNLVNDILDFNKIRSGKLQLERITFSLSEFLQQQQTAFKISAQDKGLDFSVQLDPRIPDLLEGDTTRLNQIFSNLISNAIKFTHKGFVKLIADLESLNENACIVSFKVKDSGVGIAPGKIDSIFQPFQQSEAYISRKYGGSGLGLSIVKSLVELINGSVTCQSVPGEGTVFTVNLKFEIAELSSAQTLTAMAPSQKIPEIEAGKQVKVLYVEDVKSNRFLIENLLHDHYIQCTSVASGKAALVQTLKHKFDVILMDIQMPVMNGYLATEKIRVQLRGKNKNTPVIAFTAEPYSTALKNKTLQHHIQYVITKPFDPGNLITKINWYAKSSATGKCLFSFDFYEEAFNHEPAKIAKIKKAILVDLVRFAKKLTENNKKKHMLGLRSEIHRIRPIIKNLNCAALIDRLEQFRLHEHYIPEINLLTKEATSMTNELIKQLKKYKSVNPKNRQL